MQHITSTPFGRRLRASDFSAAEAARAPLPEQSRDKWALLKDLTAARAAFGVKDRDLQVLHALVSFHPHATLAEGDGTIVFPSNAALAERAHGMAESTLRRHLAALVKAGLLLRHDSPNGKRYARRAGARIAVAYGFDLRPLILREAEIAQAAQAAREAENRRKALREALVLALRDVAQMVGFAEDLPQLAELRDRHALITRSLRRKLSLDQLIALHQDACALRTQVTALLTAPETEPPETADLSGNDCENERHTECSNIKYLESEKAEKDARTQQPTALPQRRHAEDLTLGQVLQACPDALDYANEPIRDWHALTRLAATLAPMIGISLQLWHQACEAMGPLSAAITVLAILQRLGQIRSPGGYLRDLSTRAEQGRFSPAPMIQALLHSGTAAAA